MLLRPRLLDRLVTPHPSQATVVAAAAGYGKTTLLKQASGAHVDAPGRLHCLLTCRSESSVGSSLATALHQAIDGPAARVPPGPVHDLAASVVGVLRRQAPRHITLLLDDVHELLPGSEGAQLLRSLVITLPANVHLVLAGRRPPPVPLARLAVEGRCESIDALDLAFTDHEVVEFAALRGIPPSTVAACGGWPALAELLAAGRGDVVGDYVEQEVVCGLQPDRRKALALLAHLGRCDDVTARAVLGTVADLDLAEIARRVPLVTRLRGGEWSVHALWKGVLADAVSPAEVAEARRQAGRLLSRRGRTRAAMPLLIDAAAWDDLTDAVATALGPAHPTVATGELTEWLALLPSDARRTPGGRLLAAALAAESDPDSAWRWFEGCVATFRDLGHVAGELTCLVWMAKLAWWRDQPDRLAALTRRVLELEATGCEQAGALARLGRALLHDVQNDSHQMLSELNRIPVASLDEAWRGIVGWGRAVGLLQLGHLPEAQAAAEQALVHAGFMPAPLAEMTRLQALWLQGRVTEVTDALPALVRHVTESGDQGHVALVSAESTTMYALQGQVRQATRSLARARAAALVAPDSPLVDVMVSVAEATVSVASGDEVTAADALAAQVARHPVNRGRTAAAQRRHVALLYVLVPAMRPAWDDAELGRPYRDGVDLARALVSVRERNRLVPEALRLVDPGIVQAHLPVPWVAELAVAAVAAGHHDGWKLLGRTWPASRAPVADLARRSNGRSGKIAREALAQLAAPPSDRLALRLLGPVELHAGDGPVQAPDWRRERVRSLLAYLATWKTVHRARLAEDLWPALDPEARDRNFRVNLSHLLRVLEPDRGRRDASFFIRQHGSNLSLHASEWLEVDLWDFDALCQRAESAERHGSTDAALDHALRAVALWRGEPVELMSEGWAVPAFEQRRIQFVAMATRAGERLLARNDVDRALGLAEQALLIDPWLDAGHRLVVACHRVAHRHLAAKRALSRYRDALHELGFSPHEVTAMVDCLLERLPDGRCAATGGRSAATLTEPRP